MSTPTITPPAAATTATTNLTIKRTACFRLHLTTASTTTSRHTTTLLQQICTTYRHLVNHLLHVAHTKHLTSFTRLKRETYHDLRHHSTYRTLPSHYLYTACQMATAIYKSFRKRQRRGKTTKPTPLFKKPVIMLDDHLFRIDWEQQHLSLATPAGRIRIPLQYGTYHHKFRTWNTGQAWLVYRADTNSWFLHVVFSTTVPQRPETTYRDVIGVDVNENNHTIATEKEIIRFQTKERHIRTAYYRKRRNIQQKIHCRPLQKKLLTKYRQRERRRLKDLYHKISNQIIKKAQQEHAAIAIENLTHIRNRMRYSKQLNGRLHRWGFRQFQQMLKEKAHAFGIAVIRVNPRGTSSHCPICGVKLQPSPNGQRLLYCPACDREFDRDAVGSVAIRRRGADHLPLDVGSVSVPPESLLRNPLVVEAGNLSVAHVTNVTCAAER